MNAQDILTALKTTATESPALAEALAQFCQSGIDGIALDAICSEDPAKIEDAKKALLEARKNFMRIYQGMGLTERRILEQQIADAAKILA